MGQAAIFFDRDNTLIINDAYLGDPAQVRLVPGAAAAVARARQLGFAIVTISNQGGVAKGAHSEEDVVATNRRMDELLRQENPNAVIDRHEFCPFHPEGTVEQYRQESERRKPRPGMILEAAAAMKLDLPASWVIGDAPRDIEAGHAAGCGTILVQNPSLAPSAAAAWPSNVEPDQTVANLSEAMDVIEMATRSTGPAAPQSAAAAQHHQMGQLEQVARQILDHMRRRHEHPMDFSVARLLAGVTQTLALAAAAANYFVRPSDAPTLPILVAIFLQLLTISLLLMGR